MQPPAPRPHQPGPVGDADTVLLNTRMINRAARSITGPRPTYPSPYPPASTSTSTHDQASPNAGGDADDDPKFALTSTQVVASMSAAVVAAFIGAQLGVAGTIVGAAIASVVSVVGSAVIGHSLLLTRRRVVRTVQHRRGDGPADEAETALLTAVTRQDLDRVAQRAPDGVPIAAPRPSRSPGVTPEKRAGWWSRPGRLRWMLVGLAASVAVFAGALGAVTVVEAVTGNPISGGSSGFSVLGGDRGRDDSPTSTAPSSGSSTSSTSVTTEPSTADPTTASSTAPATTSAPTTGGSSGASTTAPSTTAPTTTSAQPGTATSAAAATANSAAPTTG